MTMETAIFYDLPLIGVSTEASISWRSLSTRAFRKHLQVSMASSAGGGHRDESGELAMNPKVISLVGEVPLIHL